MTDNPYQSPDPDADRFAKPPIRQPSLLVVVGALVLGTGGAIFAIMLPSLMAAMGYSPWWFVAAVLVAIVVTIAVESWRRALALIIALPIGFVVGAACLFAWFWTLENTSMQLFNDKGSGPLGMVLLVVVPGIAAFLATAACCSRWLGADWK